MITWVEGQKGAFTSLYVREKFTNDKETLPPVPIGTLFRVMLVEEGIRMVIALDDYWYGKERVSGKTLTVYQSADGYKDAFHRKAQIEPALDLGNVLEQATAPGANRGSDPYRTGPVHGKMTMPTFNVPEDPLLALTDESAPSSDAPS